MEGVFDGPRGYWLSCFGHCNLWGLFFSPLFFTSNNLGDMMFNLARHALLLQTKWESCFFWIVSLICFTSKKRGRHQFNVHLKRLGRHDVFFGCFLCAFSTDGIFPFFEASTATGPNKVPWPATWRLATPRAKGETGRSISMRLVNYLLGLQVVCKIRWCNQSTKLEGIKTANFIQLTTFKGWYLRISIAILTKYHGTLGR